MDRANSGTRSIRNDTYENFAGMWIIFSDILYVYKLFIFFLIIIIYSNKIWFYFTKETNLLKIICMLTINIYKFFAYKKIAILYWILVIYVHPWQHVSLIFNFSSNLDYLYILL